MPATRKRTRKSPPSLGEVLDRLVAAAADNAEASFADLVAAAGLDKTRDFVGASLAGLDLRDEDLRGFDFTGADLRKTDFRGANMAGVSTAGADAAGALGLVPQSTAAPRRRAEAPFAPDEARRMILAGMAPPEAWVPSITMLDLSHTELGDLSPLAGLTALQWLSCAGTRIADLSPLARLVQLEILLLNRTAIIDLSPLTGLAKLRVIDLSGTEVEDLSPLDHLTDLEMIVGKRRRRHPRVAPAGDPFGIGTMARGILRGVSAVIRPGKGRS